MFTNLTQVVLAPWRLTRHLLNKVKNAGIPILNTVNIIVLTIFTLTQAWFSYMSPHIHNALDNVSLKVWKKDNQQGGCQLELEMQNKTLLFLSEARMGWSNLPKDTLALPMDASFEEVDKFYIPKKNLIFTDSFALAPNESKWLRVIMPMCSDEDIAWGNWYSNKVKAHRNDRI